MRIANRVLLALLFLAPFLLAASCRPLVKEVFKSPKIRISDVALLSNPVAEPGKPWAFTLTLAVDNPNGYPLNVSHVAYTAILGREAVAEGEHRSDIRIEPLAVTEVRVPLTVRHEAFSNVLRRVVQAHRLEYEFNGSAGIVAPVVGVVRVPFSRTGTLDLVTLLKKKGLKFN